MGRPKEYTDEKIKEINDKLEKYIKETEIPIIAEFAYLNDIRKATLYDHEGFSYSIKKCIAKKEAMLEKKGLNGEINTAMAIFSLKQLGWRDRQEIETVGETIIKVDLID
jgi:hypothetical protein